MKSKYTKKDIGKICPIESCKGELKRLKNKPQDLKYFKRYKCKSCEREMIMDKEGYGMYDNINPRVKL